MFWKRKLVTQAPAERRFVRVFKTDTGEDLTITIQGFYLGQMREKDIGKLVSEGWKLQSREDWT